MAQINLVKHLENKLSKCECRINGISEEIKNLSERRRKYYELASLVSDYENEMAIKFLLKELITDCKNGKFIEVPKIFSEQ